MRVIAWSVVFGAMGALACAQRAAPAASPAEKVDNSGRAALTEQLDAIGAKETAARRAVVAGIRTKAQAAARQKEVRAKMIALLGGAWPEKSELHPQVMGASVHEGVRVERVLYESQPKFYVTALLYTPERATGDAAKGEKLPAVLMAPGHSPLGKAGDAATAMAFAHAGFVVLSYDPLGQGERLQYPDPKNPGHTLLKGPTGEHGEAGLQPTLIGDAVARYFLIDAVRGVDYLLMRPEVDAKRIGAFGCSGGGLMTALTAALDTRIAAAGVACFTTSWDALLPSLGPQDSEQSTPNWIASGLDFPDWSELFAPKPYAIIATTEDMFPFAGAQASEKEARGFYSLFGASEDLSFITGPGHHGHLQPILPRILEFFVKHLNAQPDAVGAAMVAKASAPVVDDPNAVRAAGLPVADTQVTKTGQVATSFADAETVWSLNLKRVKEKLPQHSVKTVAELQKDVREVTKARLPGGVLDVDTGQHALSHADYGAPNGGGPRTMIDITQLTYKNSDGLWLDGLLLAPSRDSRTDGPKLPAHLVLLPEIPKEDEGGNEVGAFPESIWMNWENEASRGEVIFILCPRPSPPGIEETKAWQLGTFYLTELRAELIGNTLVGLRLDDAFQALNFLAAFTHVDANNITAEASGHMALVLLHAAVLDPRLKHVTLRALPPTYTKMLHTPIPQDAPEDILPGVLLRYDTPDLIRALGDRVTVVP